ncbi:MAG: hypothetical protein ACRD0K_30980 [Egibacteraceae bacterium]
MAQVAPGRVLTYGLAEWADWRAEKVQLDADARFRVRDPRVGLPLPGGHNGGDALAALAVADANKVPLEQAVEALAHVPVSQWRMKPARTTGGITVLNDAYNANPAFTEAAVARPRPGDAVLAKASRSVGLERVARALPASGTCVLDPRGIPRGSSTHGVGRG